MLKKKTKQTLKKQKCKNICRSRRPRQPKKREWNYHNCPNNHHNSNANTNSSSCKYSNK